MSDLFHQTFELKTAREERDRKNQAFKEAEDRYETALETLRATVESMVEAGQLEGETSYLCYGHVVRISDEGEITIEAAEEMPRRVNTEQAEGAA